MTTWVLLRGLARESRHWGRFATALEACPFATTVVAIDLPGNGRRHGESSPVTVPAMVDAYRAELARQRLPPPYRLFAMSLGAMAATCWATRHPEELTGAVLVNSSMRGFGRWYQRLRPRMLLRLAALIGKRDAEAFERAVLKMTSRHPVPSVEEFLSQSAAWRRSHPVAALNALRQLCAAARFRAPAAVPPVPLLVLVGAGDELVDPQCSVRIAQAWDASLAIHPTAGHDLTLDDSDWVLRELADWLGRTDRLQEVLAVSGRQVDEAHEQRQIG